VVGRDTGPAIAAALPVRRRRLCWVLAAAFTPTVGATEPVPAGHPQRRWYDAAESMRQLALGWGDQPYGAVLVTTAGLVAEGPSRVVKNADPDAHAEREAIREAQRRLGTRDLSGSVLYSTSRPCRSCEQAAAQAGVSRMYFGPQLVDAGAPRL
jgi:tRNA(Arg) A34 adenosine deaminase TadA